MSWCGRRFAFFFDDCVAGCEDCGAAELLFAAAPLNGRAATAKTHAIVNTVAASANRRHTRSILFTIDM